MNSSERVEALGAWVSCGYPATDDPQLLQAVHTATRWAAEVTDADTNVRDLLDAGRASWSAGLGADPLALLSRTGMGHCPIAGCSGLVGQRSPQAWAADVLAALLQPVAAAALLARRGTLNDRLLDRAAARTRRQITAGERITLPSSLHLLSRP